MTLSSTNLKDQYYGDSSTADFNVTGQFQNANELLVTVLDTDGVTEIPRTLNSHYTVAGGNGSTGVVTFTGGNIPTGDGNPGSQIVTITRNMPLTQAADLTENDPFPADSVERSLGDRVFMVLQQQQEQINRCLKFAVSISSGVSAQSPFPSALRVLRWKADGSGLENGPTTDNLDELVAIITEIQAVAAIDDEIVALAAIDADIVTVADNIASVNTVATNIANINAVAGNATNINAVAGNAANINAVAGNATNINNVAGNATNINAVAGNASNINAVAGISASIVTCASNIVAIQNAPTEASNAASSAAAAAASANAAQAAAAGIKYKASVRAATTANITLSGAQTIDGVSVVAGDRVLVKNQGTGSQNGIYVAASGAWARSTDADSWDEIVSMAVPVEEGTNNADRTFICTNNSGGTLGSTAITITDWSAALLDGTVTAAKLASDAVTTVKILNSNVTNAKLANMAARTIKANNGGSAAAPTDSTLSDVLDQIWGGGASTRGSIFYRGAAGWATLAPGTSGHFLKSNGAGADPSYAAGSGGSAPVLLATVNAAGLSNLDFIGLLTSTYPNYLLMLNDLMLTSAGNMWLRYGRSGTIGSGLTYDSASDGRNSQGNPTAGELENERQLEISGNVSVATSEAYNGMIYIFNPSHSGRTTFAHWRASFITNGTTRKENISGAGREQTTTPVTDLRVLNSGSTYVSGTARLFGLPAV